MPIAFTCPSCKLKARALDGNEGKLVRCPSCKTPVVLPGLASQLPPLPDDEPIIETNGIEPSFPPPPPPPPPSAFYHRDPPRNAATNPFPTSLVLAISSATLSLVAITAIFLPLISWGFFFPLVSWCAVSLAIVASGLGAISLVVALHQEKELKGPAVAIGIGLFTILITGGITLLAAPQLNQMLNQWK